MNSEMLLALERLAALRDSGVISVEEYDRLRASVLQGPGSSAATEGLRPTLPRTSTSGKFLRAVSAAQQLAREKFDNTSMAEAIRIGQERAALQSAQRELRKKSRQEMMEWIRSGSRPDP